MFGVGVWLKRWQGVGGGLRPLPQEGGTLGKYPHPMEYGRLKLDKKMDKEVSGD